MSLGVVALDQFPFRIRASGVEIAQYGDAQPLCVEGVCENLLPSELGASIGIDGALGALSVIGRRSGMPYVAHELENTMVQVP